MAISLRSLLRSAISAVVPMGEDPDLLLEQLILDLEAMIPPLDHQQTWSAAGLRLLEKELAAQDAREAELVEGLHAALESPEQDSLALALAASLEALHEARRLALAQQQVFLRAHQESLEVKRQVLSRVQARCRQVASFLAADQEAAVRLRIAETVSRLARVELDPGLMEEIQGIEHAADREAAERDLPEPSPQGVFDLSAETQRLRNLEVLERVRTSEPPPPPEPEPEIELEPESNPEPEPQPDSEPDPEPTPEPEPESDPEPEPEPEPTPEPEPEPESESEKKSEGELDPFSNHRD